MSKKNKKRSFKKFEKKLIKLCKEYGFTSFEWKDMDSTKHFWIVKCREGEGLIGPAQRALNLDPEDYKWLMKSILKSNLSVIEEPKPSCCVSKKEEDSKDGEE